MAHVRRFHLEGECYHVTSVVRGRVPLFRLAAYAEIVVAALQFQRRERAFLLAYAVMPDHFHALFAPKPAWNISQVVQSVKGWTARLINARNEVRGPLWQRSFYDRMIRSERELFETIDYIHLNPVVAGLVGDPEAYVFSSAAEAESNDLEAFFGNEPRLESLGYGDTIGAARGGTALVPEVSRSLQGQEGL